MFIEIGPDGTLSALGGRRASDAVFVPLLRPGQAGPAAVPTALAGRTCTAWRWTGPRCCPPGQRVDLPTYAFQRQRYWPRPAPAGAGTCGGGPGAGRIRCWARRWNWPAARGTC